MKYIKDIMQENITNIATQHLITQSNVKQCKIELFKYLEEIIITDYNNNSIVDEIIITHQKTIRRKRTYIKVIQELKRNINKFLHNIKQIPQEDIKEEINERAKDFVENWYMEITLPF